MRFNYLANKSAIKIRTINLTSVCSFISLCEAATRMQCSGVALKDESDTGGFIVAAPVSLAEN
jgi:hypothetical protein